MKLKQLLNHRSDSNGFKKQINDVRNFMSLLDFDSFGLIELENRINQNIDSAFMKYVSSVIHTTDTDIYEESELFDDVAKNNTLYIDNQWIKQHILIDSFKYLFDGCDACNIKFVEPPNEYHYMDDFLPNTESLCDVAKYEVAMLSSICFTIDLLDSMKLINKSLIKERYDSIRNMITSNMSYYMLYDGLMQRNDAVELMLLMTTMDKTKKEKYYLMNRLAVGNSFGGCYTTEHEDNLRCDLQQRIENLGIVGFV